MSWPTAVLNEVRHVGTMNPSDRQRNKFDGPGLSVTQAPAAWRNKAILSGNEWVLTCPDGCFLNASDVDEAHLDESTTWGLENDLLEPCLVSVSLVKDLNDKTDFALTLVSSEIGIQQDVGYLSLETATLESLLLERCLSLSGNSLFCLLSGKEFDVGSEGLEIGCVRSHRATNRLRERMMQDREVVGRIALDQCLMVYSEDVLLLDGVYWGASSDDLSDIPPRGIIHERVLRNWTAAMIEPVPHRYHRFFETFPVAT